MGSPPPLWTMLKNAPFTNVGFPKEKIFDICWCQNPRLLEGFHQLFHKSVLASLFHPLSGCFSRKSDKKRVFQVLLSAALWTKTCHFILRKKKIYCYIKNVTFVKLILQEFCLKWRRKELFLALWGRVPKRVNTGLNHEVMGVASPTGLATWSSLKWPVQPVWPLWKCLQTGLT